MYIKKYRPLKRIELAQSDIYRADIIFRGAINILATIKDSDLSMFINHVFNNCIINWDTSYLNRNKYKRPVMKTSSPEILFAQLNSTINVFLILLI